MPPGASGILSALHILVTFCGSLCQYSGQISQKSQPTACKGPYLLLVVKKGTVLGAQVYEKVPKLIYELTGFSLHMPYYSTSLY